MSIVGTPDQVLEAVQIMDPRLTANSAKNRQYGVFRGANQVTSRISNSTNFSNSSIIIDANPPSTGTYIDRKMYVRTVFRIVFTGTSTPGNVLLQAKGMRTAPGVSNGVSYLQSARAYPFSNICANAQIQLGNTLISSNLNSYQRALTRYMNDTDSQNLDYSLCPSYPDQYFEYASTDPSYLIQFSNRNPLGSSLANTVVSPRGSFWGCVITQNTATDAVVEMTVTEPFWLPPCLSHRDDTQLAFIGLQNLQMVFNLASRSGNIAYGLWSSAPDPTLSTINTINADVISSSGLFQYYTPPLTQSIPQSLNYSYSEVTNYITRFNDILAPASSQLLQFNAIQLNSVPDRVYIYISDADSNFTNETTDTFAVIESINVTFVNQDGLLNNMTQEQLYLMSLNNGCNLSYEQFTDRVGSVLCLSWGTDIAVASPLQSPGVRGQFNFSFQIRVRNQSRQNINPQINAVICQAGVLTISNNNVTRNIGVLNEQDVLQVLENGAEMPYTVSRNVYGGFKWSSIAKFFGKIPGLLRKGTNFLDKVGLSNPYVDLVKQGLTLSGNGRRKSRRVRGRGMLGRDELNDLLE